MNSKPQAPLLRSSLLADVSHGFTTREGGVSTGAHGSLTLAPREGLPERELVTNWERVVQAVGGEDVGALALLHQVHGAHVVHVTEGRGPLEVIGEGDGAVTRSSNVILAVRTADCVPVLLAAPGAIGVAHSGWRGTAARVAPATVRALCELAGCEPSDVRAAVGPAISGAAYETGDAVVDAIVASGVPRTVVEVAGVEGRAHADVAAAVLHQLERLGVQTEHVAGCTFSDQRFHSHRRDGPASGRQAGVIVRWS